MPFTEYKNFTWSCFYVSLNFHQIGLVNSFFSPDFLTMFPCSAFFKNSLNQYQDTFFNLKYLEKSFNFSVPPICNNVAMFWCFRRVICIFFEQISGYIFLIGYSYFMTLSRISSFVNSKYLEKCNWYSALDNEEKYILVSGYSTI